MKNKYLISFLVFFTFYSNAGFYNSEQEVKKMQECAEHGDWGCMTILGTFYSTLNETPTELINQDDQKAIYWLNKAIVRYNEDHFTLIDTYNFSEAWIYDFMGHIYSSQYSKLFNHKKAIENYEISSKLSGGKYGAYELGMIYYTGKGVDKNHSLAKEWLFLSLKYNNKALEILEKIN